jgi:hypothetical protein
MGPHNGPIMAPLREHTWAPMGPNMGPPNGPNLGPYMDPYWADMGPNGAHLDVANSYKLVTHQANKKHA